jgi:site-specific recombinase XerD
MARNWFNREVKQRFLATYPEGTAQSYKRIFDHSSEMEHEYDKDLANFDIHEIREFLESLEPSTAESARTSGRIVSAYLNWALENGVRTISPYNPLANVSKEWFDEFVVYEQHKLFLTDKRLMRVEDTCANAQDAVIIRLLWEGVNGKAVAELCNLRKQDVDWERRVLHLTDQDGSKRELEVSETCIEYIKDALKQKYYVKKNGFVEDLPANISKETELADNDYIIRNSITHTDKIDEPVDKFTIYRRIEVLKETNGFDKLTVKNIQRSGMIYYAKTLLQKRGKLGMDELKIIANRFKINNVYKMQEYVNVDIIERLYGKAVYQ